MRSIISAGRCPTPPGANTSFKIEYSRGIIGDQVNFTCHFRLLEPLDAACGNYSVNKTTNTDITSIICLNGTLEAILIKYYVLEYICYSAKSNVLLTW